MRAGCDWTSGSPLGSLLDVGTGESASAVDLRRRVAERAQALRGLGVGSGHVVTIVRETGIAVFADLFAIWRIGACAAVLDPALSPPERANVERFLRPAARLGERDEALEGSARVLPGSGLDAPALILLTSGTTGDPKAVVLSHRALLARIALNRAHIGDGALSRSLLTLPLHFGHGLIGNALTPLLSGGTLVLHPRGPAFAGRLGRLVDEHRIGFLSSVPTFWRLALRSGAPPAGGSLARVHVGSAPLSAELWQAIADWTRAEVVNCYGITETANWIGGQSSKGGFADGGVGRPWGGCFAVRAADGAVSPAGEGEVLVRTPSVMEGYLDRSDLSAAALPGGWYATGDTGTVDAAGALTLSGRIKDEINRAGQKIQPADVDLVLEAHPDVAEACVFAIPDAVSGEAIAAAIVREIGSEIGRKALAEWCAGRLRPAAVPERWFFVDAIPRTARGKISRSLVRDSLMQATVDV